MELINWVDMLLYAVNFILLVVAIRLLLYKPIAKFLNDRRERVRAELAEAKSKKHDAEQLKKEYEQLMVSARDEAADIIKQGRERADAQYNEILSQGKQEYKEIIERALKETELERHAAIEDMREDITDMAIKIAESVLEREVSKEDNSRVIDDFFKKVG